MATLKEIEELEKKYKNTFVAFEGNDEVFPFYGSVIGFKLNTDNSVLVILKDMEDDCFDINWEELENSEFDYNE